MKILKITIVNFRRLKDISFETGESINTIVGPNGIGKSSILDAIRLIKAILLSNTDNEASQTLQHMGLYSPHLNDLLFENICGDIKRDTTIELKIQLNKEEIEVIKNDITNFNLLRLQNQLGQIGSSKLNLVNYLSTTGGHQKLVSIAKDTTELLKEFEKNCIASIKLIIARNNVQGLNGFHNELVTFLFKSPVFSETLFTVFPADRNFPTGDINIQLGQGEINQQIQSYSIQPQLKFNRLKAAIISYLMLNDNKLEPIQQDFKLIFDTLLPGKQLEGIKMETRTGRLSVNIKENETGATYDIDFLSSGEKGLLLTLFLLLRTVGKNGIVLLDEPELHLNPAVCQNIIPFIIENICIPKNVQFILTTHSSEILASTKEDEKCRLLHLINDNTISPIFNKDNEEAQEAIKCLGIRTSDLLFNRGVIYLEGSTDDEYISEILKGLISGYKIQSLGGRTIVENEIRILNETDRKGDLKGYHVFILDFDNKPSELKDTNNVKIIQWDRYSFENYLLNLNLLYDIIKELNPVDFPSSRAEFNKIVKEIAYTQIEQIALYEVLEKMSPPIINASKKEIRDKKLDEISKIISVKILDLKSHLSTFESDKWEQDFVNSVQGKIAEIRADWEESWRIKCRGKELLQALNSKFSIKKYKEFIKRLIVNNKVENSEEWKILKSKIEPIISKSK